MISRYNIFYQVYKGLRVLAYETALQLQQTDFTETEDTSEKMNNLSVALRLFSSCNYIEEQYILKSISNYPGALFDDIRNEHKRSEAQSSHINGLLQVFHHAVSSDEKQEIGSVICCSFTSFISFLLDSMYRKENALNKTLWKNFSDEELMDLNMKISKELSPELSGLYGKWILKGMNNLELIGWLKGIRHTAPDRVFNSLLQIAGNEICAARWQKIQEALTEGVMLA
jgi:hypothetical protein